jgi:hypothetical protein
LEESDMMRASFPLAASLVFFGAAQAVCGFDENHSRGSQ